MPASARPATISSAKALHLGEPHAPQSMPGSDSVMRRICSIFSMATDTSLSSRSAELAVGVFSQRISSRGQSLGGRGGAKSRIICWSRAFAMNGFSTASAPPTQPG